MRSDSSNEPLVSVLMAVHNGGPHLRLALKSLLQQTLRDFELIIVDDGSTDESRATISRYENADRRVKSVRNKQNLGLVASLNRGLALCSASLVARADADDIFHPDRLQTQVRFLESHPEVGVLGSAVEFIDQDGAVVDRKLYDFPITSAEVRLHSLLGCCLWHTTVMFRKALVNEAGQYSLDFVGGPEDYDLWARLLPTTSMANCPVPLAKQRLHDESITANWDVGFSMYCSVSQRLLSRYLDREVLHSEATSIVSLCGCDGDLDQVDCSKGYRILREVLKLAATREEQLVLRKFRSRCGSSLLRQAGVAVYTRRGRSLRLMYEACLTSPGIVFTSVLWMSLVRIVIPHAARSFLKQHTFRSSPQ